MSVTEIINEVKKLSPNERRQVLEVLQQTETPPTDDEKRCVLYERLIAKGMLKAIPPRTVKPPELRDFQPIEVEGKPVSETIIEERV